MFRKNTGSLMNYKELVSSTNKGAGTYNSKKGCCMNGKKIWKVSSAKNISWENLITFPSRIQRIMQTHWGSFGNSFSTCIRQQIQLFTSWSESRQHKFSDVGNRTFRQEDHSTAGQLWWTPRGQSRDSTNSQIQATAHLSKMSSTAAKFSEASTPHSLFPLNCREQQGLKTGTSCKNSQEYKNNVEKGYSLSRRC